MGEPMHNSERATVPGQLPTRDLNGQPVPPVSVIICGAKNLTPEFISAVRDLVRAAMAERVLPDKE
jgi:hypothetical protein